MEELSRQEKQGRLRREEINVQGKLVRCRKGEGRCREEKDGAEKERLLGREKETLMQRREEDDAEKERMKQRGEEGDAEQMKR